MATSAQVQQLPPAYEIIDGEPAAPLLDLETVWFQIAGTLCNLTCTHCFVECSPTNHTHEFMTFDQMRERMDEGIELGAREFGFTGGEPFMHPQIIETLTYSLKRARTLVLSNATLFRPKMAQRLRAMLDESSDEHEFEIRVSLDGVTAEQNDSVRGEGALDRAMAGIRELLGVGIRPTVATTATWGSTPDEKITRQMQALMAEQGVEDCPIKIFPNVLLGAEEKRLRTYREGERVTAKCVEGADPRALMCSNSRLVTERGAWVCTLLANIDGAKMGETIADTMRPFKITEGACYTCFTQGVRCSGD